MGNGFGSYTNPYKGTNADTGTHSDTNTGTNNDVHSDADRDANPSADRDANPDRYGYIRWSLLGALHDH